MFMPAHRNTDFAWWATVAWKLVTLELHCLKSVISSSLSVSVTRLFLIVLIAFLKCSALLLTPKNSRKKTVSMSLILTCLDSSRWLTHTSLFFPFLPLSALTIALTLCASLTCWQQFVSRYQFSASRLRGRQGCGNHLHLRLLGSVPLGMLADTCHWAAVRQKGCGMWARAAQVTVISFQKPLKLKP